MEEWCQSSQGQICRLCNTLNSVKCLFIWVVEHETGNSILVTCEPTISGFLSPQNPEVDEYHSQAINLSPQMCPRLYPRRASVCACGILLLLLYKFCDPQNFGKVELWQS